MRKLLLLLIASSFLWVSCSDDDSTTGPSDYTVPSTYNYEGVDYSDQTARLTLVSEIKGMISGSDVDLSAVKAKWDQVSSSTHPTGQQLFGTIFLSVETDSDKGVASNGSGGYVSNESKTYLVNAKGQEYAQIFEKGMMGAMMLHNVVLYTENDKIGNEIDKAEALKNWDQAFGLFGAPTAFPETTDGVSFVSKYCNNYNNLTGVNKKIMSEGYLLGRSALMNADNESVSGAVKVIRDSWEKALAAAAIHYLNSAKANLTDDAARIHSLSEYWAFAWSIQFNPGHNEAYQEALDKVGDNFWTVTVADLNSAIDILAKAYGWESVKHDF